MLFSNGLLDGRVTALDATTLAPRWSTVVGKESFLHGVTDTELPVVIAAPASGRLVGLAPGTGEEQWRIDLNNGVLAGLVTGSNGVWFVASDYPGEGDASAPVLRAVNTITGRTLWANTGLVATDWQWGRPTILDNLVIMLDVPNPQAGSETASLLAFDSGNGDLVRTTDLRSPTEAFDFGLVAVLDFGDGPTLIVRTVDSDIVRVDHTTGQIRWRTFIPQGRLGGTELAPNGTLAIDITTPRGQILLDHTTGVTIEEATG